jgi:signal transduction histidine kinase
MNWTLIFLFSTFLCICIIVCLVIKLCRVKEQISAIKDALEDMKEGNLNRRILARKTI